MHRERMYYFSSVYGMFYWLLSINLNKILKNENFKVNTQYLSPLILAYEERITEKDEKLRLLKVFLKFILKYDHVFFSINFKLILKNKIDDLTSKFKTIIDENNELHSKYEKIPENVQSQL